MNFSPVLQEALDAESIDDVRIVVWVGDGAPCNWTLADQLTVAAGKVSSEKRTRCYPSGSAARKRSSPRASRLPSSTS